MSDKPVAAVRACPFGGYTCPHCQADVLTPAGYILLPGIGSCPICEGSVIITDSVAQAANQARLRFKSAQAKLSKSC